MTVLDQHTAKFHQVLVDAAAKKVLDPVQVEAAERQAYLNRYGKLDPALYTRLQTAAPDEAIPAAIQLTTPDLITVEAQLAWSQANSPDQIRRERLALFSQVLSAQARPLVEMLAAQGRPVYAGPHSHDFNPARRGDDSSGRKSDCSRDGRGRADAAG